MAQLEYHFKRFDTLDSTNTKARELAKTGAAHGTVVVAGTQTAGRGRGTRTWHSPAGGLYFSIIIYPKKGSRVTDFALMAGTALAQGIKEIFPKAADISVKWPNDVLINWKKAGGILSEALEANGNLAVILGIGVNVNVDEKELQVFQSNPFPATSVKAELKSDQSAEELFQIILQKFSNLYQAYLAEGFQSVQYYWEKNCRMIGKKIELRDKGWQATTKDPKGETDVGVTVGTMLGIDGDGALVLSNAKGERHQYTTGEISCFWPST